MYVAHFGLRRRPFRPTPDPTAYYPATTHEDALQMVQSALADGEGIALVVGEPGSGKTLLAALLVERLADQASCIVITNAHLRDRADLLQALLYDLGLPYEGKREQELRLALTNALLERFAAGQQTVVIVDEAHHLPADLLEELRLLGNLETRDGKAVQVVLLAQSEILDTLRRSELRALAQRLTARATLSRLDAIESADYLLHQLRLAGARPENVLGDEATELLARSALGIPRVLNQAAHLALTLTSQVGAGRVDAEAALEALARLGLEPPLEPSVTPDPTPAVEADWRPETFPLQASELAPRLAFVPGRSG